MYTYAMLYTSGECVNNLASVKPIRSNDVLGFNIYQKYVNTIWSHNRSVQCYAVTSHL